MVYDVSKERALAQVDPEGPAGWAQGADGRWRREHHGHQLEVWREQAWLWSMDGQHCNGGEPSLERACRRARMAAARGRVPAVSNGRLR